MLFVIVFQLQMISLLQVYMRSYVMEMHKLGLVTTADHLGGLPLGYPFISILQKYCINFCFQIHSGRFIFFFERGRDLETVGSVPNPFSTACGLPLSLTGHGALETGATIRVTPRVVAHFLCAADHFWEHRKLFSLQAGYHLLKKSIYIFIKNGYFKFGLYRFLDAQF